MRRTLTALVLALVTALVVLPAPPYAADAAARPEQRGRWLLDGQGRVRIDDGVNMVFKRTPSAPDATGFGAAAAGFLQRSGFTTVRLGLIWRAAEPRPGRYDEAYLDRVARTVRV